MNVGDELKQILTDGSLESLMSSARENPQLLSKGKTTNTVISWLVPSDLWVGSPPAGIYGNV